MKQTAMFHPFLFAVYSVLGIYSQNATQVPVDWLIRPLVILAMGSVLLYGLVNRIVKDREYAGWITTLSVIWLFSGHIYRLLLGLSQFWRTPLGGIIALLLFSALILIFASRTLWQRLKNPRAITSFLNTVSLLLVLVSASVVVTALYRSDTQVREIRDRVSGFDVRLSKADSFLPDIYLIVLDAYGREDILRDVYGFDNSQFISFLKGRGFYIAGESTANYPQTELSISSSMNLQYLDGIVEGLGETEDRSPLRELIQHTVLRRILEEQGYKFVALPSAALFAQIKDADIYLGLTSCDVNEFEGLVLSSTIAGVLVESWGVDLPVQGYGLHRDYILAALDKLQEVPGITGPKFVFTHILSPHPPFIFDATGDFTIPPRPYSTWDASLFPGTPEEYKTGYANQMVYINKRLIEVITTIQESSATPPIIIIQGDHGPGAYYDTLELDESCLAERFSILNAYYFPDREYDLLYPSITPVNSFRVILNQYFGTDLELLDDKSYFAGWLTPYQFTDVSDKINTACRMP